MRNAPRRRGSNYSRIYSIKFEIWTRLNREPDLVFEICDTQPTSNKKRSVSECCTAEIITASVFSSNIREAFDIVVDCWRLIRQTMDVTRRFFHMLYRFSDVIINQSKWNGPLTTVITNQDRMNQNHNKANKKWNKRQKREEKKTSKTVDESSFLYGTLSTWRVTDYTTSVEIISLNFGSE